jgi:hypothetical protein
LDGWRAIIGEEFGVVLFTFHDFDTFYSIGPLLPVKFTGRPISTVVLFTHRNHECSDHFHVTLSVNGQPRKESPGQYRTLCITERRGGRAYSAAFADIGMKSSGFPGE